ncbi:MAG TPA: SgcJ/EcaC family oxidoreductase [Candidatus Polarisedimenticolaceae bacterium]|nr:SgcJ/EcaC family oxidoreductase [Candidatus Polarisedimenticolaceae bacterium]
MRDRWVLASEMAVRELIQSLQEAWNLHDGRAVAACFTEQADYVAADGARMCGRAAIERELSARMAHAPDHPLAFDNAPLKLLRHDVGLVLGSWRQAQRRGVATLVLVREEGDWRIAALQNTDVSRTSG